MCIAHIVSYLLHFLFFGQLKGCFPVHDLLKVVNIGVFNKTSYKSLIIEDVSGVDANICLLKCLEDMTCNSVIMCSSPIQQCFLFSEHIDIHDSNNDENYDCYKINLERCYNNGKYNDNDCQCIGNNTGYRCELQEPGYCSSGRVWSLTLSLLPNNSLDYGTRPELYNSVRTGKGLKVSITTGNPEYTTIYNTEHSGASASHHLWAFTVENVKLDYLNSTDSFSVRHRLEISSVQPYASEWSMTFNKKDENVASIQNFTVKWFHENKIGPSPCLEMVGGNETLGSINNCQSYINKAADVYLVDTLTNTKATTVYSNSTYLVGYRHPIPAHREPFKNKYVFTNPLYLINNIELSHGVDKYVRWYVSTAKYINNYANVAEGQWFIDNCWIESVSISDTGYIISGSILHLLKSLKNGIPIKVEYNNYTSTIKDVISVNETTVIAVTDDILDDSDVKQGIMIRRMITTSSLIVSVSYIWEQNSTNNSTIQTGGTRWFVENRQTWEKIMTFNESRDVVFGLVDQVYDAAINGSGFRIVIHHNVSVTRYVPINIVHVYNSTFVVLETGTMSSIQSSGGDYMLFQWDGFLSTTGVYETMKWSTGSHLLQGRTLESYTKLDVFIQK